MTTTVKLLVSLAIGVLTAIIVSVIYTGELVEPVILIGCAVAALCGALVGTVGARSADAAAGSSRKRKSSTRETAASGPAEVDGERVQGKVKWFNVSKGFGFIVQDDGEEIFVHFRSIRGQGRRGLRDGQRVSFVVVDSEKGPQAEDVAPE